MADIFKGIITADGKKRQLPYNAVLETPVSDETLSIQGGFADAKVVGDNFKKVNAETDSLKEDLDNKIEHVGGYKEYDIGTPSVGTYWNKNAKKQLESISIVQSNFTKGWNISL